MNFSPRPSFGIWITEKPNDDKIGIEFLESHLNLNLNEYYRDFKNGVKIYHDKITRNPELFQTFLDSDVTIHRMQDERNFNKNQASN